MIPIFQDLSKKIGKKKVIWRYDPIIFTKKYTPEYHLKVFEQIAISLKGYTEKCVISFVDVYAKNMERLDSYGIDKTQLLAFAKELSRIAKENGMTIGSCAESIEIGTYNTCKNGCKYCYANYSDVSVAKSCGKYNPESPLLCGMLAEDDKITERKVKSLINI